MTDPLGQNDCESVMLAVIEHFHFENALAAKRRSPPPTYEK
jgi:hypothetical protein